MHVAPALTSSVCSCIVPKSVIFDIVDGKRCAGSRPAVGTSYRPNETAPFTPLGMGSIAPFCVADPSSDASLERRPQVRGRVPGALALEGGRGAEDADVVVAVADDGE